MEKYTLGVDFGSLSARAVICRVSDGKVMAQHEKAYPHGVMTDALPDGTKIPAGCFFQHPQDYLDALEESVCGAIAASGLDAGEIIGMALDFTGCTVVPLGKDRLPLALTEKFKSHPYAYVNMWKQRNAIEEAAEIEEVIRRHDPDMLKCYGGHVAPEILFCKALRTMREDPEVFAATDRLIEAGEYLLQLLIGEEVRNTSMASVKSYWDAERGYPEYLKEVHPAFEHPEKTFLRGRMVRPYERAGALVPEMAQRLHLPAGISVAGGHYDGHSAVYALNVRGDGSAMVSLGTSSVLSFGAEKFGEVEGVASALWGFILPQHYAYASGQPAFGDTLSWFVNNALPADVKTAAEKTGMNVHQYLTQEAAKLSPGENALIALDWWNGNRSTLQNGNLTGMMLGMTLQTTAAEMYRALIEGICYGMRRMVDSYTEKGFEINMLNTCGGISFKNPLLMQILSDVTNLPVRMSKNVPAPAVGMCMLAAVAAEAYDNIYDAMEHMHCLDEGMYYPDPARAATYEKLYEEYLRLHDYFGRGANPVMKTLREIAQKAREKQ